MSSLRVSVSVIAMFAIAAAQAAEVQVAPGDSIPEALAKVGGGKLKLLPGAHFLDGPLKLGKANKGITISGAGAILSAGQVIGAWQPDAALKNGWKAPVNFPVRQLFSEKHGRLQRSRIPNSGFLRGDRLSVVDFDVNRNATRDLANGWRLTKPHLFTGLRFREGDLPTGLEAGGAMMQALAAWESSWHPLRSIDQKTRDIHLFTPSRYPLAHWSYGVNEGGGTPYAIENSRAGLDLPGEWLFDTEKMEILLLLDEGATPEADAFIASKQTLVLEIDGADAVTIKDLTIAHSGYELGRYDQHKNWPEALRKTDPSFPENFPPGLALPQAAPGCGSAVRLRNTQGTVLSNCTIRHCGGYAIEVGRGARSTEITGSTFTDLGGGAIDVEQGSTGTTVSHCKILRGGQVHAAAVGIRIADSPDNLIQHNEVAHFGYSGISLGWAWNPRPTKTTGNRILNNHVHHVMEKLSDGAGIYTLGAIPGTVIAGNFVHDIARAETAIGAGNSGIFFDQYSKGATVERNVIRRCPAYHARDKRDDHPIKHNLNKPGDHVFKDNDIDAGDSPVQLQDVVEKAGPGA